MKSLLSILSGLLLFFGCNTQSEKAQQVSNFPGPFEKGLDAHGGLDLWDTMGTLSFTELNGSDTIIYTVDLKSRDELIEKKEQYKVGFTADSISFHPNRDSFPGKNPRFTHNLRFYFFALHFVTADPGAFQEVLQPAELEGKMYNRVKITFGDGVGVAPKDQYILWYDQVDNLLAYCNYSVTYFNERNAEKYSALKYDNWVEVEGLKFPTEVISYHWKKDSLGDKKYGKKFTDIAISKARPDTKLFTF
ncbi:MAG: hypothetical protein JXQ96_01720 [Cyclobacteriaceae bacterium]